MQHSEIFEAAGQAKTIVVDTETTGLDWRVDHVVGYVLSIPSGPGAYLPVRHGIAPGAWDGQDHPIDVMIRNLLADPDKRIIFHHAQFDLAMLGNHGIEVKGTCEDTLVNQGLIDENQGNFSLLRCAEVMGVEAKKGNELYKYLAEKYGGIPDKTSMEHFWKLDSNDPMAHTYAEGDGITTAELWKAQQTEMERQGLMRVHGWECRLIPILNRMTRVGIRVDEERLFAVKQEVECRLEGALDSLPSKDFNVRSPLQLRDYFKDEIAKGDWPTTKTGAPCFDQDALEDHDEDSPILVVRKLRHILSSFIEPMLNRHLHNGRVHAQFNQSKRDDYGVVGGRLSSNDPNLQQVPKRDKELGTLYRSIFLPEVGQLWSTNDYVQQEYVIFTDYTQNPMLVAGYSKVPPDDMHTVVAKMMGIDRELAKRMNMGMMNGIGKDKMAKKLKQNKEITLGYLAQYDTMIPEAKRWRKKAEIRCRQRGYVHTYLGRRRHIPDRRHCYKAWSGVIQGSSADLTKIKMVEIDDYFQSEGEGQIGLMLQVHDAFDWSFHPEFVKHDIEARRIMQSFGPDDEVELSIPIQIDHNTGKNWSIATYGEQS